MALRAGNASFFDTGPNWIRVVLKECKSHLSRADRRQPNMMNLCSLSSAKSQSRSMLSLSAPDLAAWPAQKNFESHGLVVSP